MARDFSKNTSNYVSLGANAISSRLSGAAGITIGAWINGDVFDSTDFNNRILSPLISSTTTSGIVFCVAGGPPARLRIAARSETAGTLFTCDGSTTLSTGTWYHLAATIDIAGDAMGVYVNGASDGTSSPTFVSTSYTPGTPTGPDLIGAVPSAGGTPSSTGVQFDGRIADLAVWNAALSSGEIAGMARGVSPMRVRTASLVAYYPMIGDGSSVTNFRGGTPLGTITGSIPHAAHAPVSSPSIGMPRRRRFSSAPNSYTLTASSGSFTLSGQAATLTTARKVSCSAGSFALTGNAAGLASSRKVVAAAGTFTLTGNAAGLTLARSLVASAGAFTLTGQDASLEADRLVSASSGTFVLTGSDATLAKVGDYTLAGSAGVFTLDGQSAGLTASRTLTAADGEFDVVGNDAGLNLVRAVGASVGEFDLSGQDATPLAARVLTCSAGSFSLTGNQAALEKTGASVLAAGVGSFVLTGQSAGLASSRKLIAAAGAFSLAGNAADLDLVRKLSASAGAFTLAGNAADLNYVASLSLDADTGAFSLSGAAATLTYTPFNVHGHATLTYTVPRVTIEII